MLIFVIIVSLILAVLMNVLTSCYVCYNVAVSPDAPKTTILTVTGIVILNALFPYFLGCVTGLWYIG
jgi:hypothetical protein